MRIILSFMLLCCFWLLALPVALAQHDEDTQSQADRVDLLLERARKHTVIDSAAFLAKEAYELANSTQYHGAFCRAALFLAESAESSKRPFDAVRYYVEASSQANLISDVQLINRIYKGLGNLYMREHIYKSAIENYKKALLREPEDEYLLKSVGDAYIAERQFDSVQVYYSKLLKNYQSRGDYASEVKYHRKMIEAHQKTNQLDEVLKHYLRVDTILDKQGTPEERAILYNNLGSIYLTQGDYEKALKFLEKVQWQCTISNCDAIKAALLVNKAVCLFNLGQITESQNYLLKGIEELQKRKDYTSLAYAEEMLSGIYLNTNDLYNAQRHNELARNYAQTAKDSEALVRGYQRAADIHFELYALEEAIEFYKLYLTLTDSLRVLDRQKISKQGELKSDLERTERETRGLMFAQEMKARALQAAQKDKELLEATNRALAAEARQKEEALLQSAERQRLTDSELKVKSLEALQAQSELRNAARQRLFDLQKNQITARLHAEELDRKQAEADAARQKGELDLLQRDNQIKELELRDNQNFKRYASLGGLLSLFILMLLGAGWAWSRRTNNRLNTQNKAIEQQKALIDQERRRSDQLLLNILPEEVAAELKTKGHATPRVYEEVSVVFTDFQNFTKLTAHASPELVLSELNTCFQAFDAICERHGLEKIKTIGDAYMAAAGVPLLNAKSAHNAVQAAIEMLVFLKERKHQDPSVLLTNMRIGIHTGQVVAGVVGKNKFAYDIWGDTVNTAARMEEYGEAGRVNITAKTAKLVANDFNLIDRGLLTVHSKGEMQMYFVEEKA